jgi:hypothetical protein
LEYTPKQKKRFKTGQGGPKWHVGIWANKLANPFDKDINLQETKYTPLFGTRGSAALEAGDWPDVCGG